MRARVCKDCAFVCVCVCIRTPERFCLSYNVEKFVLFVVAAFHFFARARGVSYCFTKNKTRDRLYASS